jgi:hypothetical protein
MKQSQTVANKHKNAWRPHPNTALREGTHALAACPENGNYHCGSPSLGRRNGTTGWPANWAVNQKYETRC